MTTDLFASIRKRDTGVSTSYSAALEHPEHPEFQGVFRGNPQKSAPEHLEHSEHPVSQAERWKALAAEYEADWQMPIEWADALAAIRLMDRPEIATADRWEQLVNDAVVLATRHHRSAVDHEWTISDVFGFDLNDAGEMGLLLHMRGGTLVFLTDGTAVIIQPDAVRRYVGRPQNRDLPPIWTLNRRARKRGKDSDFG
jgi:hypothetical protein